MSVEQLTLIDDCSAKPTIVNVASVPHRSVFRYPGGKTWLIPKIRIWTAFKLTKETVLIEPFCGGGIVSLSVAFENDLKRVVMCEFDPEVAAVWKIILSDDYEWLCNTIANFELTIDNATAIIEKDNKTVRELAFTTLLRNRINHGGILAPGSGMLKNGENGKGIASRWYPSTLVKRIKDIQQVRHKITFIEGDGITYMDENTNDENALFFIDPPYTASTKNAGKRLYNFPIIDHELLFDLSAKVIGDFVMTYDNDPNVKSMAEKRGFFYREIPMKNTHHAKMTELIIGNHDLDYLCRVY